MSARVCDECGAFVKLPRIPLELIGRWPLRLPRHLRGKRRGEQLCPASGSVVPVVAE